MVSLLQMRCRAGLLCLVWFGTCLPAQADEATARLLSQARQAFVDLSDREATWLEAVARGDVWDGFASRTEEEPGERAEEPLRTELVNWLCRGELPPGLITRRGISVRHLKWTGPLELQFAKVPFPLRFIDCEFPDGIDVQNAELMELHLDGTQTSWLFADQLRVARDLSLKDGFTATGEVRLPYAWIEGHLDLSGAKLLNRQPDTLHADGCRVDGDVRLRYEFEATHRVSLVGMRIKGSLDADQAVFRLPGQTVWDLSGASIGGDWSFRETVVDGGIMAHGTSIGGDLDGDRSRLSQPDGEAFRGYALETGGDLRFVGANIVGDVLLESADVHRDLNFADVHFGPGESKVLLQSVTATRRFRWTGITYADEAHVELDLRSATAGILFDDAASWPAAEKLRLHGFDYAQIHDDAPIDPASRINWLRRQPTGRFRAQPYEHLAAVLQQSGQSVSAREVLIAKEMDRAERSKVSAGDWFWYRVFGPMIGFGYEPWRAVQLMLVTIVLGALIFQWGYWHQWMTPTKVVEHVIDSELEPRLSPDYPTFNALIYSLDVFTPLTYLHQADYWMPNPTRGPLYRIAGISIRAGDLLRIYMWFHVVAGWTLTSLLIAGLSGLVEHQ